MSLMTGSHSAIDGKMNEACLDGGARIYHYLRAGLVREFSSSMTLVDRTIEKPYSASRIALNPGGGRGHHVLVPCQTPAQSRDRIKKTICRASLWDLGVLLVLK
jgi:hypothetical protein